MTLLEYLKRDYCVLVARFVEGVTVCKGDLVPSQLYCSEFVLRQYPTNESI